jgi:hypothetical protein
MLVPGDCQQRVLPSVYDMFFSVGVLVSLLLELAIALLAISRYLHFMDFRRLLLKVTTRSIRE